MLRSRKAICSVASAILLLAIGTANAQEGGSKPSTDVKLTDVKYQGLVDALKAAKGNVVVVDVWATYCIPCKREFPSFVKLHEKLGKDGVVCISVSVDEKDNREAALKYLQKQNATMANYWLDENPEIWGKKWNVKAVPVVFVFDKEGKPARKFSNDVVDPKKPDGFTYDDVNKIVDDLLKGKF